MSAALEAFGAGCTCEQSGGIGGILSCAGAPEMQAGRPDWICAAAVCGICGIMGCDAADDHAGVHRHRGYHGGEWPGPGAAGAFR